MSYTTSESKRISDWMDMGGLHEHRCFSAIFFSSLKFDSNQKRKGRTIDWQDLYFPIGCGMVKGGVPANTPLEKQPDGSYAPVICND